MLMILVPAGGSFEVLGAEVPASLRAFVTLVRQNVSSSLRHIFSVGNSDFAARILVAFTAFSSSAQRGGSRRCDRPSAVGGRVP